MATHFFNPGYEVSIGKQISHYTPSKLVQRLRVDLQTLPLYYANDNEKVYIQSALPSHLVHDKMTDDRNKVSQLIPWGWAPELCTLFPHLELPYTAKEMTFLASRARSIEAWHAIKNSAFFLPNFLPPKKLEATDEINGAHVVKEEFSSSGRGITIVHDTHDATAIIRQIQTKRRWFSIEPFYDISQEIGYEFHRNANGEISYLGRHTAITENGKYIGSRLETSDHTQYPTIPSEEDYINALQTALQTLPLNHYKGILGVDTALCLIGTQYAYTPCLEVNIRPTMGYVAIKLQESYLGKQQRGQFRILKKKDEDFRQILDQTPLYMRENLTTLPPGIYPLTPIMQDTYFVACLIVEE